MRSLIKNMTVTNKTVFEDTNHKCNYQYLLNNKNFNLLLEKYPIDSFSNKDDEITKIIKILKWTYQNVKHNNGLNDVEFVKKQSIDILDYSYKKGIEFGVYCRLQAIVFTEYCMALGFKAKIIHCLPSNKLDYESHVVASVYIPSLGKWGFFDPTYYAYFIDNNRILLSLTEIYHKLQKNEKVFCNIDFEYEQRTDLNKNGYIEYIKKNSYYFKTLLINTYGSDLVNNQKTVYTISKGFNPIKCEKTRCLHAIKNLPKHLNADWQDEYNRLTQIKEYLINDIFDLEK